MSAAEIARALAEQAETVVRGLFPHGRLDGRDWCIGSITGEPGQSLRIGLVGKYRGRWQEYADGTGGDLLDLIAAVRCGGDLRQAIGWARRWLGGEQPAVNHLASDPARDRPARYETLSVFGRGIWSCSRRIDPETPAGRYLSARRCALPHPDGDLRWHPELRHPSGYVGPALVALITDVHDAQRWLSLHRTWIAADGSEHKADVDPARLLLKGHRKSGGCIRLWPDDWVTLGLGVAEGIENALTLARGFTPVWSMIDAGNLATFPYLYPIESLTVAVDHDPAGLGAYEAVAKRWHARNREVRKVLAPKPGDDLNDWARDIDNA
ncbi:MAG: toprim domain-containing protein [Rhodospirillales bacterium]|nr:toprim domain-containing protein [Rhodospirillales bacterium]